MYYSKKHKKNKSDKNLLQFINLLHQKLFFIEKITRHGKEVTIDIESDKNYLTLIYWYQFEIFGEVQTITATIHFRVIDNKKFQIVEKFGSPKIYSILPPYPIGHVMSFQSLLEHFHN